MADTLQPEARAASGRRFTRQRRQQYQGWLLVLPLIILVSVVILGPALSSVYFAFTKWSGIGPAKWIGLDNFQRMFRDRIFWKALPNNIRWMAISLTVPIAFGLMGAALLAPIRRGQVVFRVAFFVPVVLASTVTAQIWRGLLNADVGIGAQLARLGWAGANVPWLGSTSTSLYAVAFVSFWRGWGFLVVLYLSAMQAVDHQLYEAARIEGANRLQEFWHVTLPGIRPTLAYTILFAIIGSFLVFDYIFLLTKGGPANSSEVLNTMAYNAAFTKFEAGYAAAVGLGISLLIGVVGLIFVVLRRRGWEI